MTVIATAAIPPRIHGTLTRWMLEITPQLYIGTLSAKVRDQLWNTITQNTQTGLTVLIHPSNNEQGFTIKTHQTHSRHPTDHDGLTLITITPNNTEQTLFDNKTMNPN